MKHRPKTLSLFKNKHFLHQFIHSFYIQERGHNHFLSTKGLTKSCFPQPSCGELFRDISILAAHRVLLTCGNHLFYQRPFLSLSRFSWHRKYLKSEGRLSVHSSCCHIDGDNGGPPEGSVCRFMLLLVPHHLKCNMSKKEQRCSSGEHHGVGIVQT